VQARIICKSPVGRSGARCDARLIGLARLSTKDNELDLLRMWDAVSISKDQNVVRVQTDLLLISPTNSLRKCWPCAVMAARFSMHNRGICPLGTTGSPVAAWNAWRL